MVSWRAEKLAVWMVVSKVDSKEHLLVRMLGMLLGKWMVD